MSAKKALVGFAIIAICIALLVIIFGVIGDANVIRNFINAAIMWVATTFGVDSNGVPQF
jgi:MFS-type transporter involved in bile tolerance (Atg22 family)